MKEELEDDRVDKAHSLLNWGQQSAGGHCTTTYKDAMLPVIQY